MPRTVLLPPRHYLNDGYGMKSWLLTRDHKRIGLLYLAAITLFFFIGGAFAVLIRLELATPAGDLVTDETYNKLFTMHGVMMVFFFLIPAIPSVLGNFLVPIMIGAKDLAFPKLNLASWYIYMIGAFFTLYCDRHRRARHRLDVLHAVQHRVVVDQRDPGGARHLHHRLLVDPHGPEFHRHDSPDARARDDLVPAAALHLVALCDQPDHGARHAGHRDHASCWSRPSGCSTSASSIRRSAAIRCCSSTCSGSIRTRRSTS